MSKNDKERIVFDAICGNPPYQTDTRKDKEVKGKGNNVPITNVFHYFQQVADLCGAKYTSLIYPAKRWINKSGKGMPEFGKEQLNDKHLKRLTVFENASDIFPGVGISDGISIVFKDFQKDYDKIELIVNEAEKTFVDHPGDSDLILNTIADSIVKKVDKFIKDNKLNFKNYLV